MNDPLNNDNNIWLPSNLEMRSLQRIKHFKKPKELNIFIGHPRVKLQSSWPLKIIHNSKFDFRLYWWNSSFNFKFPKIFSYLDLKAGKVSAMVKSGTGFPDSVTLWTKTGPSNRNPLWATRTIFPSKLTSRKCWNCFQASLHDLASFTTCPCFNKTPSKKMTWLTIEEGTN